MTMNATPFFSQRTPSPKNNLVFHVFLSTLLCIVWLSNGSNSGTPVPSPSPHVLLAWAATGVNATDGNITHFGLSAAIQYPIALFDYEAFEQSIVTTFNCSRRQIAVVTFGPTKVDDLILVDFVVINLDKGDEADSSTQPPAPLASEISTRFYYEFRTALPLADAYSITSVVYDTTLAIPPRVYGEPEDPDIDLPRRIGATGFIGMMVMVGFTVIASIVFVIFYLVRGRHDSTLTAAAAELKAPATHLSSWIIGGCPAIKQAAKQGAIKGLYPHISSFACGTTHMIIVASGAVWVGGDNSKGQLGLGHNKTADGFVRNKFFDDKIVRKVACGEEHSVVVLDDGTIYTFGCGAEGALGHGNWENALHPTPIKALKGMQVQGIAVGTHHTVILCEAGLYACGWNEHGQLMLGDTLSYATPQLVEYFTGYEGMIREMNCGVGSTFILCGDWEVYACGANQYGQLGLGHYEDIYLPEMVPLSETSNYVRSISTWWHTVIVCDDGVYACGEGEGYKHGLGHQECVCSLEWVSGLGNYDIWSAQAGNEHTVYTSTHSELFVVGRSTGGKLGYGDLDFDVPTELRLSQVVNTTDAAVDDTTGVPIAESVVLGPTYTVVMLNCSPFLPHAPKDTRAPTDNEPFDPPPPTKSQAVEPTRRKKKAKKKNSDWA